MTIKKLIFCDTCEAFLYGPTLIFHIPKTKRDLCNKCFIKEAEYLDRPSNIVEDDFIEPETVSISFNWDLMSWNPSPAQVTAIIKHFSPSKRRNK